MGKSGSRRASNLPSVPHKPLSLREEKAGKKLSNTTSVKSKLKLQHLQSLAVWASGEAFVPTLAVLFGHCLASANETLQPDPSLFSCQRCETILQPGFNCTIRIEKNQIKVRHGRKKTKTSTQNRVVYKCHFCSHRNMKRGTPEGHMKDIYTPKAKPSLKPKCAEIPLEQSTKAAKDRKSNVEVNKVDEIALPAIAKDSPFSNSPLTPSVKSKITLEGKKRRRSNPGSNNSDEPESNSAITDGKTVGASCKRRRRSSWTSLKEIAKRSEHDSGQNSINLPITFSL